MKAPFLPTTARIADPDRGYLAPKVWTLFFEFFARLFRGETNGATMTWGTGSPEGVVPQPVASLFFRTDGASGTTLYLKTSGTGNTGWEAIG